MKLTDSTMQPTGNGPTISTPRGPWGAFRRPALAGLLALAVLPATAAVTQLPYLDGPRALIQRGVQAVLLCNGLLTSERPLGAVYAEELAYLKAPLGTPETVTGPENPSGLVMVDEAERLVRIGQAGAGSVSARYQPGICCVVLPPDHDAEDLAALPTLPEAPAAEANDQTLWPRGDLGALAAPGPEVDTAALAAASAWAFDRPTAEQNTTALLILHPGTGVRRHRSRLRRPFLAGPLYAHGRSGDGVRHIGESGPVRHHPAGEGSGDRSPRSRLGPAGLRPLGSPPGSAQGLLARTGRRALGTLRPFS
jgi:hypothetical protein